MKKIILILMFVCLLSSVSAINVTWFGANESDTSQFIPILLTDEGVVKTDINFSTTNQWATNIGLLTDVNDTQFNNLANVLTLDLSWLDSIVCFLTGCEMTGNLTITGNVTVDGSINAGGSQLSGSLGVGKIETIRQGSNILHTQTVDAASGPFIEFLKRRSDWDLISDEDGIGGIRFSGADGTNAAAGAAIIARAESPTSGRIPGKLVFQTTNLAGNLQDRMIVNTEGFVGIGQTTPLFKLQVEHTQNTNGRVIKFENAGTNAVSDLIAMDINTAAANTGNLYVLFQDAGGNIGQIRGNGAGIDYVTTSDIRHKFNIQNLTNVLSKIMQVTPISYTGENSINRNYGFSAQEIYSLFPNSGIVSYDEEEDLYMMAYDSIIPINTRAIQELVIEGQELKQQVNEQNQTIFELESRLELIEQMLNVTYIEPEENSLPLYYCAIERSTKECPGGISGGFNTRCYLIEPKISPWDYCLDGWSLV